MSEKTAEKKVSKGRNNSKERERVDRFHSFTFVRMVLFCPPLLEKKKPVQHTVVQFLPPSIAVKLLVFAFRVLQLFLVTQG